MQKYIADDDAVVVNGKILLFLNINLMKKKTIHNISIKLNLIRLTINFEEISVIFSLICFQLNDYTSHIIWGIILLIKIIIPDFSFLFNACACANE